MIAEVIASVVLLVATGLLVRALWTIQATRSGLPRRGVLTLRTDLPCPKYAVTARRADFYNRVLDQVRALPGVTNAAYISGLPMVMARRHLAGRASRRRARARAPTTPPACAS